MLTLTTESIPGKTYEVLALVQGSTVQTVNAIRDIGAGLKNLIGGEVKKYSEMMEDARSLAMKRMEDQASRLGADAVVAVRFTTASVMQGAAEVLAYGTAVRFV